ncbi:MAG: hypothetical protein ACYSU5_20525 [Planctomycetota bacterium]
MFIVGSCRNRSASVDHSGSRGERKPPWSGYLRAEQGPFQELFPTAIEGQLETELGPGDPGFVGGRWVLIVGGEPVKYFSCPLLGPGREEP